MSTLEKVREIIRAEVAKARPVGESRHALALIVESSVRFKDTDGEPRIDIVDARGEVRRRDGGGAFTIGDLLDEIREGHPTLFDHADDSDPSAAARESAERPAAEGRTAAGSAASTEPPLPHPQPSRTRDWLMVREEGLNNEVLQASSAGSDVGTVKGNTAPLADRLARPLASVRDVPAKPNAAEEQVLAPPDDRDGAPRAPRAIDVGRGPRPPLPRGAIAASAVVLAILGGGALGYWLTRPTTEDFTAVAAASPSPAAPAPAPEKPADPPSTGSVKPASTNNAPLKGIPDVIDTATLSLNGKVLPLFGVEWVRGAGDPADLSNYLRKREVRCEPAASEATAYRCEVEGQDLSKVVLYNGGGRATSTATPDLQAAESHARSAKIGLWGR